VPHGPAPPEYGEARYLNWLRHSVTQRHPLTLRTSWVVTSGTDQGPAPMSSGVGGRILDSPGVHR
jgi:hypothetical protein